MGQRHSKQDKSIVEEAPSSEQVDITVNEQLDFLAFSKMILVALSHDFVTPLRAASNCCVSILKLDDPSGRFDERDRSLISEARGAIKAVAPQLNRLYEELTGMTEHSPEAMLRFLTAEIQPVIDAPTSKLRAVERMLQGKDLNDELRAVSKDLEAATKKLNNMIGMFRQSINRDRRPSPSSLSASTASSLESVESIYRRAGLPMTLIRDNGSATLNFHSGQLYSVFSNLIGNAIKYAKPGVQPKIEVAVGRCRDPIVIAEKVVQKAFDDRAPGEGEKAGQGLYGFFLEHARKYPNWVEIQITDYGKGIQKKRIWGVFKLFKQLDEADAEAEVKASGLQAPLVEAFEKFDDDAIPTMTGVGLGLSLTQYYVRRHAGEIAVSSRKGGPTTFGIWLPINDVSKISPGRLRRDVWWYNGR